MTERRHLTLREIGMISTLLLNFGALVWGAATMSSSVRTLTTTTDKLDRSIQTITSKMDDIRLDYSSRMATMEVRVTVLEKQVNDLNNKRN